LDFTVSLFCWKIYQSNMKSVALKCVAAMCLLIPCCDRSETSDKRSSAGAAAENVNLQRQAAVTPTDAVAPKQGDSQHIMDKAGNIADLSKEGLFVVTRNSSIVFKFGEGGNPQAAGRLKGYDLNPPNKLGVSSWLDRDNDGLVEQVRMNDGKTYALSWESDATRGLVVKISGGDP
jgi:hypothetical protein